MATTAVLAQDALNISVTLQNNIQNGVYEDPYQCISDLCAALNALGEVIYANASTLSTDTATTVSLGKQYANTTASTTAPIYTKQR